MSKKEGPCTIIRSEYRGILKHPEIKVGHDELEACKACHTYCCCFNCNLQRFTPILGERQGVDVRNPPISSSNRLN